MAKKGLILLVLAAVVAGGVFAQTDFESMPKNTITVDVGPTIFGAAFGQLGSIVDRFLDENMDLTLKSGFGIGAQYERQLIKQLSIAGRFAYLGVGADLQMRDNSTIMGVSVNVNTSLDIDVTTLSGEGHLRFYPTGNGFFLGGMAGYGNLKMNILGDVGVTVPITGVSGSIPAIRVNLDELRHYVKVGGRLGWRFDFGNPGGFVFEPSLGYDHAIGLGDDFGKRLQAYVQAQGAGNIANFSNLDKTLKLIENYVFAGGPRLSLAFGLRF